MEQFGAAEGLTVSIAFENRDGHGFHPLVGGEPEFAIQAFASPPNTFAAIGSAGLQNPTICVLAGRALHRPMTSKLKVVPSLDALSSPEQGCVAAGFFDCFLWRSLCFRH